MSSVGSVPWWVALLSSRWGACEGTNSRDAETDWGVWGSQLMRGVKAGVCGSFWIHGSHSGERWAGLESASEAQSL